MISEMKLVVISISPGLGKKLVQNHRMVLMKLFVCIKKKSPEYKTTATKCLKLYLDSRLCIFGEFMLVYLKF